VHDGPYAIQRALHAASSATTPSSFERTIAYVSSRAHFPLRFVITGSGGTYDRYSSSVSLTKQVVPVVSSPINFFTSVKTLQVVSPSASVEKSNPKQVT